MSPRLPSGVLLAATVATAAAAAATVAAPALAVTGTPVVPAGTAAKADKIRDSEWWLSSLHVTQAWQASRGSGVTVALLSTGVLTTHPDLAGSVTTGPDYTGSGETAASPGWGIEGTSAASIIAGHGDNTGDASGIIGIAPAARILSVRVAFDAADPLNASPTAVERLPEAIAEGIRYAVTQGAKVIDLPLDPSTLASDGAATGGLAAAAGGSAAERSAVSYAESKGVVLVAPAGDNGDDGNTPSAPASYPGVIALGAVDRHGALGVFSARQSYVALTAPGVGVTAASQPSGYRNMSTTDASSAIAAGIAVLIRSKYPNLTASQVRQALISGSTKSAAAGTVGAGAGTVDALKAVQAAAAIANPQPTAQPTPKPSTPAATSGAVAPLTAQPKPSTVGLAKSALRDAAAAAGGLIIVLLGVLLGLRLWRRRSGAEVQPASEQPRTLLDARLGPPSGPQPIPASSARHARAGAEFAFAPAGAGLAAGPRDASPRDASPRDASPAPDTVSPRFAPPGVLAMEPDGLDDVLGRASEPAAPQAIPEDQGPEGGRARRGRSGRPAARAVARNQESGPTGPPWAPAPAPAGEAPAEPWRRPPDPFSRAARPGPVSPAPWDTAGPGPAGTPRPELPAGPQRGAWDERLDDPLSGPDLPRRDPGLTGVGDPFAALPADPGPAPAGGPSTPRPAPGGAAPIAWRPVPLSGPALPGVPAPPGGPSGPAMGRPTPPEGLPAIPATGRPTPPEGLPAAPATGFPTPPEGLPAVPPAGPAAPARPTPPAGFPRPGGPDQPRPISPRDRLPLQEPDGSGPAALAPPPAPPAPALPPAPAPAAWRIPGSSGRFAGAGAEGQAPEVPPAADPAWPVDGYPGRTGRLSRGGEFLPPYAGRPAPGAEPEPGPAPAAPPAAAEPDGSWTDESPSGPLYIWNPAALTEPFPTDPPDPPDDSPGPHPHHA